MTSNQLILDFDPAEIEATIIELEEELHKWKLLRALRRILVHPSPSMPPEVQEAIKVQAPYMKVRKTVKHGVRGDQIVSWLESQTESHTQKEISEGTGISNNAMSFHINSLLGQGRIRRDPANPRKYFVAFKRPGEEPTVPDFCYPKGDE